MYTYICIYVYEYIYSFHHLLSPRWKSQLIDLNVQSLVTQSGGTQEWPKTFFNKLCMLQRFLSQSSCIIVAFPCYICLNMFKQDYITCYI